MDLTNLFKFIISSFKVLGYKCLHNYQNFYNSKPQLKYKKQKNVTCDLLSHFLCTNTNIMIYSIYLN